MRYQMTRPDRFYRARTLLQRAGYDTSTTNGDTSGLRTLLLEVKIRPEDDTEYVARIIHGSDPDAHRIH